MRKTIILFLLLFITKSSFGQEIINLKIYLDSLEIRCNYENHIYYRIVNAHNIPKENYFATDYYLSGAKKQTGYYSDNHAYIKNGEFVCYNEKGNILSKMNFLNDKANGKYELYYESGKLKQNGVFQEINDESSEILIYNFWDNNENQTVIEKNGFLNDISDSGNENGKILDGRKDGQWIGFDNKSKANFIETYKEGKLISGLSTDLEGNTYKYEEINVKAVPLKGMQKFNKYISKNFNMPNIENLKGRILTLFKVDKFGKIINPKIIRGIGYGTDEEALRILKESENWNPGKLRGINVETLFVLPITLKNP